MPLILTFLLRQYYKQINEYWQGCRDRLQENDGFLNRFPEKDDLSIRYLSQES
ncbi:hypothetical protein [Planktothrix mougeotii]|uniref:Transposase n=1 Tax=Planktothrix mougeotii LEGE 06226 TaxID=1828728 RepID=A0ABR9U651_9CYAN|nr:hypothetical protein [Planktothrix mougeotii]MBE9141928.1 hypothetical protein [Planktothrix mougeotii LEGE 06226]